MTSNRDPDLRPSEPRKRPQDYVRREDGSWSTFPILLGVAVVLGLGYMFFLTDWNASTNEPLNKGPTSERSSGSTPPSNATPPTTK